VRQRSLRPSASRRERFPTCAKVQSELGSCLKEARTSSVVFSHLAQIKSSTPAPGSRCLSSVPFQPFHVERTLPEPPRLLYTSLPPPPLLHLTSPALRLLLFVEKTAPTYFGTGHGASDTTPGVVVSLDRFMCDAPVLPAPFDEFQPGYNNIRLPRCPAGLKVLGLVLP
jgi:hypothetical protein